MARLLTNGAVDLTGLDLNAILAGSTGWRLESGVNDTIFGIVYPDVYVVESSVAGGPLLLWGEGLAVDPLGRLVAGSVQGLALGGTRFAPDWILQLIDLPATRLDKAMRSAGTSDDLALLRLALAGDDSALLKNVDNRVFGGLGNDTLDAARGNDTLSGDGGNDSIVGFFGADLLYGGSGNDSIAAGPDNDTAYGGSGADYIWATGGENRFYGGSGADSLFGGNGASTLRGGGDNDTIAGGASGDVLLGGAGNDVITGGQGDDRLNGEGGDDALSGEDGNDRLLGGAGADTLSGGRGADILAGDTGNDLLSGDDGDDVLRGGDGADTLSGGNSSDTLVGGAGNDLLTGGTGADLFVFSASGGRDTIQDFEPTGFFPDRLQLSGSLWDGAGTLSAAEVVARFATVGGDGWVRLVFREAGTVIVLEGVTDASLLVPQIDII